MQVTDLFPAPAHPGQRTDEQTHHGGAVQQRRPSVRPGQPGRAGDGVGITLVFQAPANVVVRHVYTNTAFVNSTCARQQSHQQQSASVGVRVQVTQSATLRIAKNRDAQPRAVPGTELAYTIYVTNTGPSDRDQRHYLRHVAGQLYTGAGS